MARSPGGLGRILDVEVAVLAGPASIPGGPCPGCGCSSRAAAGTPPEPMAKPGPGGCRSPSRRCSTSASSNPPMSRVRSRAASTPDPPPGIQFWRSNRSPTAGSRGGVSDFHEISHCALMFTDPVHDHLASGIPGQAVQLRAEPCSGAQRSSSSTKASQAVPTPGLSRCYVRRTPPVVLGMTERNGSERRPGSRCKDARCRRRRRHRRPPTSRSTSLLRENRVQRALASNRPPVVWWE